MTPAKPTKKATAATAKMHKWEVRLIRKRGQFVGLVEAPDATAAIKAAIEIYEIKDPEQRKRLVAQRVR